MIIREYIVDKRDTINDIEKWCYKQFGTCAYTYWSPGDYNWSMYAYTGTKRIRLLFSDDKDHTWFLLKWGGYVCTE